jgi:hypothetical protein
MLKVRLLQEDPDSGALVIHALHGMGGIGKTLLVAAFAHDHGVRIRFHNGVLWVTLGREPDLLSLLGSWIQALGDDSFRPTSVDAGAAHLRSLLDNRSALLVVDDAWEAQHVRPFLVGRHCRVLITTRRAVVAGDPNVGADLSTLDSMREGEALALLEARLRRGLEGQERVEAAQLAGAVGGHPLALTLAAARVRRGVPWAVLRQALEEEVPRHEELEDPGGKVALLGAAFNLSLGPCAGRTRQPGKRSSGWARCGRIRCSPPQWWPGSRASARTWPSRC